MSSEISAEGLAHLGLRGRQGRSWAPENMVRDVQMAVQGVLLSRFLANIVGPLPYKAARILEVGCGSGKLGIYLALRGLGEVVLLDLDPQELDYSRNLLALVEKELGLLPPVEYREGDAFSLPFEDDSFDLVFNEGVLSRWSPSSEEAVAMAREMARVSHKWVAFAVADATDPVWAERARESSEHPYTGGEAAALLRRVGLRDVWVSGNVMPGFVVAVGTCG